MMLLSAEYSHHPHGHGQDQMGAAPCHPPPALHTPRHAMYASYLMDPPSSWHHTMKQEPEDNSVNNDSGISPSHYNSDGSGSVQNTSPQSFHSEARSDDSGHPDREDHQTNATLGVLARPIMDASSSPQHASIGFLAQPVLGEPQSPQQAQSPLRMSPQQRLTSTSPQAAMSPLNHQLSPRQNFSPQARLSPQDHSVQSFLLPGDTTPQSPRQNYSPQQPPHSSPSATPHATPSTKPLDDNSRSSASSTEMDMFYDDPLRGLQMALQRRGMMGPLPAEQPVNGEKPLQCPLCQYSTTIRSAFNNHLMSEHSEQVSCHLCDHTAENNIKLKEHLRVEHDTQLGPEDEWGEDDEAGVTTPKVNSQGKVKTYRCKQCEFSTVTKLEFWEHTRGHIKPERLLTCPKCPFVTEYKHHLEYHLRNHFGSKPFKCDKCPYSCVNKSMLNSHLKSHSNVYQFRCSDCAYATKYCHSLKLHLRKYNHNPAMVLNPDGSPNPLPIVDVYGTRRGPKRPKKSDEISPSQQPALPPTLHPMFSNPYGFLPNQTIPYPYNTLMNTFHRNPMIPFPNYPIVHEEPAQPKVEPENHLFNAAITTIQQSTINNNQEGVKEFLTRVISTQQDIIARTVNSEEESLKASHGAPLDLSRPEPEQQDEPAELNVDQTPDQSVITKNRRKGKAFKLERIAQRLHQQSSDEEGCEPTPKRLRLELSPEHLKEKSEEVPLTSSDTEVKAPSPSSPKVNFCEPVNEEFKSSISEERKARWKNVKEVYDCTYCDMLFGDVVMYTMHMGYHGYQNPFTCNMCGHQTSDKVQFFLHLFRYAHG